MRAWCRAHPRLTDLAYIALGLAATIAAVVLTGGHMNPGG